MTDAICETRSGALPGAVDSQPWQLRLRALGISQSELAGAIGMTTTNVSIGLRSGSSRTLKLVILALEQMDEGQRRVWLEAARRERQKP